ncbi:MAG: chloride channel protein [Gemmatimonadaceae bacterium]
MNADLGHGSRKEGVLPLAPDLAPAMERENESAIPLVRAPREYEVVDRRTVFIAGLALIVGIAGGLVAQALVALIGLATNLFFYGRVSFAMVSPSAAGRGGVILLAIPILGALVVGLMARFGSASIRGHGIPEVMERVLQGESRIPARLMFLKPLSAAIAIGTGGPFGAEGPIIATGGALGSLVGQLVRVTADERKVLLASGAAAGMAATFGSPVSAVLLAVELLLFEYRPRSVIPVAMAAAVATAVRIVFNGTAPVFPIRDLGQPSSAALIFYTALGGVCGLIAVGITSFTYGVEDGFEALGHKYHVHWMWWPAIGAIVVGTAGILEPRTLGIGYDNIIGLLSGTIVGRAVIVLVVLKFISWAIYLGSGTSGGTMAPLFTIGAGMGAWLGALASAAAPALGIDAGVAGLVGMAALFAGASHALLASIVLAFEVTRQPVGLLPLLLGCAAAYLVSLLFSRYSIMTEKLARRDTGVRTEYSADHLAHVFVRDVASRDVISIHAKQSIDKTRAWLLEGIATGGAGAYQGFPVVDDEGLLVGVVTRRDVLDRSRSDNESIGSLLARAPAVVFEDNTLRDAADHMVLEKVGRLPVVLRDDPRTVVGILSRSDLVGAHASRLAAAHEVES